MKTKLLYLLMLLAVVADGIKAQIPNGDFENWVISPNNWHLSYYKHSSDSTYTGITKYSAAQSGNAAVKITTTLHNNDEYDVLINSWSDNPIKIGGFAYTQQPTKFKFYAKYDIKPGDKASALLIFKKNGAVISGAYTNNLYTISGTHTQDYQLFEFPVTGLTQAPDTVLILFSSSDLTNKLGSTGATPQVGSYVVLDNMSFDTSNPIPHGDFEEWGRSILHPNNFFMYGSYQATVDFNYQKPIVRTTDSHTGSYALKAKTFYCSDWEGLYITASYGDLAGEKEKKFPCNQKCGIFSGWYKYLPASGYQGDTAYIEIRLFKKGAEVGFAAKELYNQYNTYAQFKLPFLCTNVPDSATIHFNTSLSALKKNVGSTLYLDDLSILPPVDISPATPTVNDIITISTLYSDGYSQLYWGVNGWTMPNTIYQPANSINGNYVPFYQSNGTWQVQLGPFNNSIQTVNELNFAIKHTSDTWGWDNNNGNDYKVIIKSPSELSEKSSNRNISIYPQPLTDKLIVNLDTEALEHDITITISNLNGQIIRSETLETNTHPIVDRKGLNAGIYMLQLYNQEGQVIFRHKLIVQ